MLDELRSNNKNVVVICAFSKSKQIDELLYILQDDELVQYVYPLQCDHSRLLPAQELFQQMKEFRSPKFMAPYEGTVEE